LFKEKPISDLRAGIATIARGRNREERSLMVE
jgi:hypothetical protein